MFYRINGMTEDYVQYERSGTILTAFKEAIGVLLSERDQLHNCQNGTEPAVVLTDEVDALHPSSSHSQIH